MNITDWTTLSSDVQDVLKKYRILSEQDRDKGGKTVKELGYTTANLRRARDAEGRVLGHGFLLNMDVVGKFVQADTSPKSQWLDWMFFHAAGGTEALRRSTDSVSQVKERFIEERVRGYRDKSGKYHNPITKPEAEAKWNSSQLKFKDVLQVGDQDVVEKLRIFGFHRHWPGPGKIYEKLATTVAAFLKLRPKTDEMNDFMAKQGLRDKMVKIACGDYSNVEMLEKAVAKVERFFAALAARQDIRIEPIYEDDVVSVICPLTYAAAVRYGWDVWPFANRDQFETNLEGSGSDWNDAWRNITGKEEKIIIFVQFHVPMPSWINYEQGSGENKFARYTLQNLAVVLNRKQLRSADVKTAPWLDEQKRDNRTLKDVIDLIRAEVRRDDNPENEEYPVHCGPRVVTTNEEAQLIIDHLHSAVDAVTRWARGFDHKSVIADYMAKSDS